MPKLTAVICILLITKAVLAQPVQPQGEESPHEELVKQVVQNLKDITEQLAKIKDKATAAEASEPLKMLADEFLKLRKKAGKLKQPDKTDKDRIAERYQKVLAEVIKKMQSEIRRVQEIPGGLDAVKELNKALKPPPPKKK